MSDKETPEVNEEAAVATQEASVDENEYKFVEAPSFDVDYKGECAYEVKVSIPAANKKDKAAEVFQELQHDADLPGFRRGKAPRKLLENKFAKAVKGDVLEKLVSAAFRKLVKDEELRPLGYPDIDGLDDEMEKDDDDAIDFTFKFEVSPRCELGKYRGIEIEKPVMEITDVEVDSTIDEMRERFATYEPKKNIKAKDGDQVVISFKGSIDGEEFAGGAADNYPYILGSGRFFAEFEAALKGSKSGEEKTCDVEFPADYGSPEISGKTANFAITVNEIKRKVLPKVDDELATQAGHESLEAMRKEVLEQLQQGSDQQSQKILENNAIDEIVKGATFELPKSLLDESAEEYYKQEVRRLMEMRMSADAIVAQEEEIRKETREIAEKNIKSFVAVSEVGSAEGIEVTAEDFEKEAEEMVARSGMDMDTVSRFLQQEDQQDEYANRIYRQKAMAAVIENAKITEKKISREELEKQDEESNDA